MHPKGNLAESKKRKKIRKIGILLSGLGGGYPTDLWELVFLYFFLEKARFHIVNIISPDMADTNNHPGIFDISNFALGEATPLNREIGREIEALIIPGANVDQKRSGSNRNTEDENVIDRESKRFLREYFRRRKPTAACGLGAKYLTLAVSSIAESPLTVTVGNDPRIENIIERCGCVAINTREGEVIIDETNLLVTTAGHYGERKIGTVKKGMENLVAGLISLIK